MQPIVPGLRPAPTRRFAISYDTVPALARRVLAVRPDAAVVLVGDGVLDVRFGRCRLRTPLTNLAEVVTGRLRPTRSVIGMRLSPDGRGLVVGTGRGARRPGAPDGLVRVAFRRPVSAIGPAAVVLRIRWVAIAATHLDDLAAALAHAGTGNDDLARSCRT